MNNKAQAARAAVAAVLATLFAGCAMAVTASAASLRRPVMI